MRTFTLLIFMILHVSVCAEEIQHRILIKSTPPFTIKDSQGEWSGISVDLWKEVSHKLGIKYKYEESELSHILEDVSQGKALAGVGALSVTSQREQVLDFTHIFSPR
ncbi:MAG: transporter substrate-binding domain-containing protein [Planctomycetes bacterium]|nr:transporter substrate-binding domain-containing protein [Planctomycetota bacterium]